MQNFLHFFIMTTKSEKKKALSINLAAINLDSHRNVCTTVHSSARVASLGVLLGILDPHLSLGCGTPLPPSVMSVLISLLQKSNTADSSKNPFSCWFRGRKQPSFHPKCGPCQSMVEGQRRKQVELQPSSLSASPLCIQFNQLHAM